jgi:hypothetical protein
MTVEALAMDAFGTRECFLHGSRLPASALWSAHVEGAQPEPVCMHGIDADAAER